jgi:arsenate reductase (thioredoxin)
MKPKVLFVCIENSCRSQMAEGFLRHLAGDRFEALSAGARPTRLDPSAVEVMKEVGIDISRQSSKDVAQFLGRSFHYVIGVCDSIKEKCPVLPGAIWYRDWSIEDPAQAELGAAQRLITLRRVRDAIEGEVLAFIAKHG